MGRLTTDCDLHADVNQTEECEEMEGFELEHLFVLAASNCFFLLYGLTNLGEAF
jgi:hypothetical protein